MYIVVINDKFIKEIDLAIEFPNTSFPSNAISGLPENVFYCWQAPKPADPYNNYILKEPEFVNNMWVQHWIPQPLQQVQVDTNIMLKWIEIRDIRDKLMSEVDWRILRNQREQRQGISTTEDITMLDSYMQALADITKQTDPFNIIWPTAPY